MSFTKERTIWCEHCAQWQPTGESNRKWALKSMARRGWSHTKHGDFCPTCTFRGYHKLDKDSRPEPYEDESN